MKKRVLILGAGYGGIFAAANLCKEGLFDITIVDKSQYHQLLQQIHHIISKSKKPEDIIRIEELFKDDKGRNLSIVNAAIKGIDLDRKTAKMQEGDGTTETQYDYAIVSLGAETQYFGIKGAEEHCMPFRSAQDALKIQKKVEDLLPGSTVVIAGGGPAGVSLAAAMVEMDAVKDKKIKVNVVDSSESLLPGWDARLTATSERVLSAKGVKLTTRKRIKEVRADSIIVESGEKMQSDCTIWTAGVKGRDIHITPEVNKIWEDSCGPVFSNTRI